MAYIDHYVRVTNSFVVFLVQRGGVQEGLQGEAPQQQ
jgi:hypothetical protein